MKKLKLAEFFSSLNPKYLLGTTYTLSLTFFESVVWPTIPKNNLDNCLILCDNLGYHRALSEAGTLRDIGARYFVVPISAKGKFHPKVWIAANEEKVALLVGSGNLTQSGFIDNVELFWATQLDHNLNIGAISDDIRLFLDGLKALVDKNIPSSQLANNLIDAIYKLIPEGNGDRSPPRFLTSFQASLATEIQHYGTGGKLFVSSPYFGGDLEGYKLLIDTIKPSKVTLCPGIMRDGHVDVDLHKYKKSLTGVDIMKVKFCKAPRRGEHFKLYGHQGISPEENWIYCGSANCTYPAFTGKNIEAGVLLSVTSKEIFSFFTCEKLDELPQYQKEKNNDGTNTIPFLFAAYTDDGLKLTVSTCNPLLTPFVNICIEFRVGVRRSTAQLEKLFADGTTEQVRKDEFDREFPSSIFASPYLVVSGKDADGRSFTITCVIDDINTLKASAREKGATRAASAASRGESPELADIIEYFKYIEGALDDGFELAGGGRRSTSENGPAPEADRIAIWPPEPVIPPKEGAGGNNISGKFYYYWLDRMLCVFNTKKINAPPAISEGVPDDESAENNEPEEKPLKPPKEWVEALKRVESIENKFKDLSIDSKQANCVYPTAILAHLMLLSIRTSNSEKVNDADALMDSPADISSRMIRVLFADRSNSQGITDYSIAELCHQKYQVPIYKQFAEDILTAFTELILAKVDGFPINSWLIFKSLCKDHFNDFISARESIWERYTRHFPWHERGVSESSFSEALDQLKQKEWAIHPGYIAAKEIIDSIRETRGLDGTLLDNQSQAFIIHFTNRVHQNLPPFIRVSRFQRFCVSQDCKNKYVIQAELWGIEQIKPAFCKHCGTALIPDILFDIIEANHG